MHPYQQAGKILADAFLHYPLMQYAFEGRSEEQRAKALLDLHTSCSKAAALYGGVILSEDKQGALIWLNGKNFPLGLLREINSGMWTIPFKLGAKATLRLMNHDAVPEGWIAKNANGNFGYIWCVGINVSARGKGYSRQLIDQAITDMRAQGMNEFWLKTDDSKNVTIYQKLGFEIIYETIVKSSGLKSWVMKRN
ncbi:MAG: GNAT family N-acetyltransferase [Bacteroidetes bacterium]|nr:GNAT family N-acetyltransferase [Bacteroidota bacterium]